MFNPFTVYTLTLFDMFRCLLALLIINTYGRGLGLPLSEPISNSLEKLAQQCDNDFLSQEIRCKIDDCKVMFMEPYSERQFQCLLFYDINMQLCHSKVVVKEDAFNTTMKENLNAANLCTIASTWNIKNLSDHPTYKSTISKIVSNSVKCSKFCSVVDVLSEESNFYCKYYNWGSSLLRSLGNLTAQSVTEVNSVLPVDIPQKPNKSIDQLDSKPMVVSLKSTTKQNLNENQDEDKKNLKSPEVQTVKDKINPELPEVPQVKDKDSLVDVNQHTSSNSQTGIESINVGTIQQKTETAGTQILKNPSENDEIKFVAPVEEEPPRKTADVEPEAEKTVDAKETVIDNPKLKQPSQNVDYQDGDLDSEEGKEVMMEQNIDDGDDPGVADFEPKNTLNKQTTLKKFDTAVASSFDADVAQREIFPNTEGFSDGDDDNFFPFFLTGVILVIVLYVLYHNKSKVSKVVLGLIVEGRQNGRRRNSRGHSYRRLDTLEQAMNSNTATAPSRIIY